MADSNGIAGQVGLTSGNSDRNTHHFQTKQAIAKTRSMMLVKVMAVHGGGLGPPPTVDVMPLVNQIDGQGNPTPHGTIYGIPVARNHGGDSAVINDPAVGDIGLHKIADRDISTVKSTSAQANPGSFRRNHPSDGVYHGAVCNTATPKQYVFFTSTGVVIADRSGNLIQTHSGRKQIELIPATGFTIMLGGDGTHGSFDYVLTNSGPSINTKTRFA